MLKFPLNITQIILTIVFVCDALIRENINNLYLTCKYVLKKEKIFKIDNKFINVKQAQMAAMISYNK